MKSIRKFFTSAIVLMLVLACSSAFAGDPNGKWTSTTGSTVSVWANMQSLTITITTPQGQSFKYGGWWTRFSDYFAYQTNSGIHYGSFINSNKISIKGPNGSLNYWTRGVKNTYNNYQQPQQQSINITGTWRSSSGSLVQVTTNGNQIFVTLIDTQGRRHEGIGRWLRYGQTFDYSIPGFTGAAFCTVVSSRRIDVVYGQRSTWTR